MDVSTTMTMTQLTLTWILLGCLITWMLLFAFLALRPDRKKLEAEQTIIVPYVSHTTTSAPEMLRALTKAQVSVRQVSTGQVQHEVKETHSVPVHI